MKNKFNGFGPVYVINLKSRTDRKKYITKHFKKYGVKDYEFIEAVDGTKNRKDIKKYLHPDSDTDDLRDPEIAVIMSHLKTIKYWLENSNSSYAIICEDDVDLSTSDSWNFTFQEFLDAIKFKYDIIQMSITNPIKIEMHKRKRHKEYSAGCYLITRSHAEYLIDKYLVKDMFQIAGGRVNIVADELIYYTRMAYSVGLVTYLNKESNINPDKLNGNHARSIQTTKDYWRQNSAIPVARKI